MNRIQIQRRDNSTPVGYDVDFAQWCAEQGALLRDGRFDRLDRENLAEEIESLGRSDKREIESRLKVLLLHLLKLEFQSDKAKPAWTSTIIEQRGRLRKIIKESPSLRSYPSAVLDDEYVYACAEATAETGLDAGIFPKTCPYSVEQILDLKFYPHPR